MHLYLFQREKYAITSSETNCQGVNKESHNECVGVIWGNFIAITSWADFPRQVLKTQVPFPSGKQEILLPIASSKHHISRPKCLPWSSQSLPREPKSIKSFRP
jgi:hypothetical protein